VGYGNYGIPRDRQSFLMAVQAALFRARVRQQRAQDVLVAVADELDRAHEAWRAHRTLHRSVGPVCRQGVPCPSADEVATMIVAALDAYAAALDVYYEALGYPPESEFRRGVHLCGEGA
jgi:hypothetical protein